MPLGYYLRAELARVAATTPMPASAATMTPPRTHSSQPDESDAGAGVIEFPFALDEAVGKDVVGMTFEFTATFVFEFVACTSVAAIVAGSSAETSTSFSNGAKPFASTRTLRWPVATSRMTARPCALATPLFAALKMDVFDR